MRGNLTSAPKKTSEKATPPKRSSTLKRVLKGFLALVLLCAMLGGLVAVDIEGILMKDLANTQERIKNSPNFKNGAAQNKEPTPLYPPKEVQEALEKAYHQGRNSPPNESPQASRLQTLASLLKAPNVRIPSVKSDLKALQKDSFVWFGHSSYMLFLGGKSVFIDPILQDNAAPVPLIIKAFDGADIYAPDDLPNVDFFIITHNHYDHLSKKTIKALAPKVRQAIVPLGVGKYLKAWGIDESQITELDWDESVEFGDFAFYCLTARHFSGRGALDQSKSLWASFLLEYRAKSSKESLKETQGKNGVKRVYFGGDSGYGAHFAEIGKRFGGVDLAFLENGQYNPQWGLIHAFPHQTLQAALDLRAKAVMSVHNSKFKLAPHEWNEPLEQIYTLYEQGKAQSAFDFALLMPQIGQIVPLWERDFENTTWWRE